MYHQTKCKTNTASILKGDTNYQKGENAREEYYSFPHEPNTSEVRSGSPLW